MPDMYRIVAFADAELFLRWWATVVLGKTTQVSKFKLAVQGSRTGERESALCKQVSQPNSLCGYYLTRDTSFGEALPLDGRMPWTTSSDSIIRWHDNAY
jgi:hypothetical protein